MFGTLAAFGGYLVINGYANARLQREFDAVAEEIAASLTNAIEGQVAAAESASELFGGPAAPISRWAFFEFARTFPERHPALEVLAWLPRVEVDEREAYVKSAHDDGLFDFRFTQRATDGRFVKATSRGEYFPVFYVEPYPGNEPVLGLDMMADRDAAVMLARLRDGGVVGAVPASALFGDGKGVSVVVPVYRTEVAPFTVVERRAALAGFVVAGSRFDRLLESALGAVGGQPALDVEIIEPADGHAPTPLFAVTLRDGRVTGRPIGDAVEVRRASVTFDRVVGTTQWQIVVSSADDVFPTALELAAWGFAVFTLLLTVLLLHHLATMRRARDQAEAANRAKSEFLAMMSHELRTPLNAVIGFSEMMVNELFGPLSNDHYRQYTTHIHQSASHLLDMINTILDMSKVEAGYYALEKEDFRLADLWADLRPILDGALGRSGIAFEDGICDTAITVHADLRVFRQILLNLASNAIKFTPTGGRVCAHAEVDLEGCLVLRISDTGIGISETDLERVAKPFQQADSSLARKYEGVGLGLALTLKLVELQDGEVRIDSRPGEGTVVTVTFPARILVSDDDATPAETPSSEVLAHAV